VSILILPCVLLDNVVGSKKRRAYSLPNQHSLTERDQEAKVLR
jgi:hypothetical protein